MDTRAYNISGLKKAGLFIWKESIVHVILEVSFLMAHVASRLTVTRNLFCLMVLSVILISW